MRVIRAFVFVALPLTLVAGVAATALAQPLPPRGAVVVIEPEIRTKIEGALVMSNTLLTADYYKIDMRFGPRVRIDAVIVTLVDVRSSVKGLRIQVNDDGNPDRHLGESFLDVDEIAKLSRAIESMTDLAEDWTPYDDRRANEVSFTSAGGFRLAVNAFGRTQKVSVSTGVRDRIAITIQISELGTLKQALDQALAMLNGK